MMVVHMTSPDGSRDQQYISNYATLYVRHVLLRLDGVGNILFTPIFYVVCRRFGRRRQDDRPTHPQAKAPLEAMPGGPLASEPP